MSTPAFTSIGRKGAVHFLAAVSLAAVAVATLAFGALPAAAGTSPNLSGVTLTFGDQFKEYQTIMTAADALSGAPYTVDWSDFVGGPPIIAAETGGSLDIGDMAETPTIFAQSAGDPVKVVAVTESANAKVSPYDLVVPATSAVKKVSQLKGATIGVQEGTVEQYVLIQLLKKAGLSYHQVNIVNLTVVDASSAVSSGKVAAALLAQPLTAIDLASNKIRILASGAQACETLGYLTVSDKALANPKTAAAVTDFILRFYKAAAVVKAHPLVAEEAYVKIFGVSLAEAQEAAATIQAVGVPITHAIIKYQQAEANTFYKLGLITSKLNVKSIFDLPLNKVIATRAHLR